MILQARTENNNWIVPENKLDAQQRDFIDNVDINKKNVWIKGFPGRENLYCWLIP